MALLADQNDDEIIAEVCQALGVWTMVCGHADDFFFSQAKSEVQLLASLRHPNIVPSRLFYFLVPRERNWYNASLVPASDQHARVVRPGAALWP